MVSLKDYAKDKGVSYEAVRKQVSRYKDELEGHIVKQNRTQFLDDVAVEFLDQKRAASPVVVVEEAKNEDIKRLQMENENLKIKIMELQDQMIKRDDKIIELQDKILLLTVKEPEQSTRTKWRFWRKEETKK